METDIIMDNGDMIDLFDVVDMKFGAPFPIKHHKENMKFVSEGSIKFVKKLNETEKSALLQEVTDSQLLNSVESRFELYDKLIDSGRSLALVGPKASFNIEYSGDHPRLWIVGKNNREFDIPCTDLKFCAFVKSKLADFEKNSLHRVSSQDTAELKGKQIYFVIGLTGDSLDENNAIKNGEYAPEGTSKRPRYWPLVVSVLTIPSYSNGD